MRKKKYPYGKYSDNIYDNSVRMKRSYGIPLERNRYEFVFPRKYLKNTRYKRKDRPVLRSVKTVWSSLICMYKRYFFRKMRNLRGQRKYDQKMRRNWKRRKEYYPLIL